MEKRKGAALVTVIITMVVLFSMTVIISNYFMVGLRVTLNQQNYQRAYYCALGGIEIGTAILNQPTLLDIIEDPVGNPGVVTGMFTMLELYEANVANVNNGNPLVSPPIPYNDAAGVLVGEVTITIFVDNPPRDAQGRLWVYLDAEGVVFNANGDEVARHVEHKRFNAANSSDNSTRWN